MGTHANNKVAKVKKAFERNYGIPAGHVRVTPFKHPNGGDCLRVQDPDTYVWADYNVSGWRTALLQDYTLCSVPASD